mgnify:FL=1
MLGCLFPLDERKHPKAPKKRSGPPPSQPGRAANRHHRKAAELKKIRELFGRNPRALADSIAAEALPSDEPDIPPMDEVMRVHGAMFESPSPPDREPFTPKGPSPSLPFSPITPQNVKAAKRTWKLSAPGCDGVLAMKVQRCCDGALAVLFNLVLASRYQPPD